MAPLPENNTPRLFINYTSAGAAHTALVRLPSTATSSTATVALGVMATVMKAYMLSSDSITGGRFSAANSNVSFPLTFTAVAGTVAGTADPDRRPNFTSWTGRSADGRDVKFTMFTNIVDVVTSGYRDITPSTAEQAILAGLGSSGADWRSISGGAVIANSYVNYGVNAYYQRKIRRTG